MKFEHHYLACIDTRDYDERFSHLALILNDACRMTRQLSEYQNSQDGSINPL